MFRFNPHAWSLTTNSQCTPATILNPICSCANSVYFFFNDTATTEIYTLSLHDALPICLPILCGLPCVGVVSPLRFDGLLYQVAQNILILILGVDCHLSLLVGSGWFCPLAQVDVSSQRRLVEIGRAHV